MEKSVGIGTVSSKPSKSVNIQINQIDDSDSNVAKLIASAKMEFRKSYAVGVPSFTLREEIDISVTSADIIDCILEDQELFSRVISLAKQFRLKPFPVISASEITPGKFLAQGAQGRVYEATWEGIHVAVKTLSPDICKHFNLDPYFHDTVTQEWGIHSLLRHPNIVRVYGANIAPPDVILVMQFMESTLESPCRGELSLEFDEKLNIAFGISNGLAYLHSNGIIHRDLKPANILIARCKNVWVPKLGDFGLSQLIREDKEARVGSLIYMAPEVMTSDTYDAAADIYSYGIVLWQLFTEMEPYQELSTFQIYSAVETGDRPDLPEFLDSRLNFLISSCWHQMPKKRPSAAQVCCYLSFAESAGEKKIDIESYHTVTDPDSGELYTLYKIAIRVDVPQEVQNRRMSFSSLGDESERKAEQKLIIEKRYSEFYSVYKQLRAVGYKPQFKKNFPSRMVWNKFDQAVLEHRRLFLTMFMNDAWSSCQSESQQFSIMSQFLYGFEGCSASSQECLGLPK